MKTIFKLAALCLFVGAIPTKGDNIPHDWQHARIGSNVRLSSVANGFLLYRSSVSGFQVVALMVDIGNAGPSEDLSVYVVGSNRYVLAARFSVVEREFHVAEVDGKLKITISDSTYPKVSSKPVPFAEIDLKRLVEVYSEETANWFPTSI